MIIVYRNDTGEPRRVDPVDARELIATGRWSNEPPAADVLPAANKGAEPGGGGDPAPCPAADMTVIELRAALKELGVEFPSAASKADLVALYTAATFEA